ncbi:MAG TPA: cytochrome d ubiquinol oxidase subunit II [Candidatus Polarisedimenticolia bacterium]|nr:cytochrome d ubiquinol oxidase subunit II [Candidatus Polarisedimenticolia bacterium]
MGTLWFCLVAALLVLYVVLDGFDLGAGVVHLLVARSDAERRLVLRSIGPVWDGNEVWLLAAGGTLFFAFPVLYASAFSGFYLPLMIVLWLLILRGVSLEFRNHVDGPIWAPFWDVSFSASSALLAIFLGAALGNVVRGVPLDSAGWFFEPLWTDFRGDGRTGIIDWYTTLVGVAALLALAQHGALWVALKTEAGLRDRARRVALRCWWGAAAGTAIITVATFRVQPHMPARLAAASWGYLFPLLALGGLAAMRAVRGRGADRNAFLASCAYLTGMLASAAFGLYPYVLPSNGDPAHSLSVRNAAAADYGLEVGVVWWIPGIVLTAAYVTFVYRRFAGKVRIEGSGY